MYEKYWRSKIPLPLVLLFLVNFFVVIALEVLLLYRTPLPLTEESLAKFDSTYTGCTILQEHRRNQLWCYLVETQSGDVHLIPAKSNGLFLSKGRIYGKQIIPVPEDISETNYNIKIGIRTSTVTVSPEPIPYMENQQPGELFLAISYAATGDYRGTITIYIAIAAILEVLELALWHLLTRQ